MKAKRRTSTKLHKAISLHLLNSIENTGYNDFKKDLQTDKEKIEFFFNVYNLEYNLDYNKRFYPNNQERLTQYLMGLPSCISFPFYNYDILEFAKVNNWEQKSEKEEDIFIASWFRRLSTELLKLKIIHGV
jgi:hypothetical protein